MYIRKHGYGLMGLGATGGQCRTGAAFFKDGNWWVPIRDAEGKEYPLMQTPALAALPLCSSGSSGSGIFGQLLTSATDILKARLTPAPVTNITAAPSSGMSNTTKLALAGGAVVGGFLLIRALRK